MSLLDSLLFIPLHLAHLFTHVLQDLALVLKHLVEFLALFSLLGIEFLGPLCLPPTPLILLLCVYKLALNLVTLLVDIK
jgi:hypothetical protein